MINKKFIKISFEDLKLIKNISISNCLIIGAGIIDLIT